jgi:hypothetical protein
LKPPSPNPNRPGIPINWRESAVVAIEIRRHHLDMPALLGLIAKTRKIFTLKLERSPA